MSYILQALKKAEEERGASPRAVPTPRPLPPTVRPRWPWIAGGILGLVGVAGLGVLWWQGSLPDRAPTQTAGVERRASSPPPAATRAERAPVTARPEPAPPRAEPVSPRPQPAPAQPGPTAVSAQPAPVRAEPVRPRAEPAPPRTEPALPRAEPVSPRLEPTPLRVQRPSPVATPPAPSRAERPSAPPATPAPVLRGPSAGDRPVAAITAPPLPAERVSPARPAAAPIHPDTPPAAVPAAPATDLKALTARLSLQVLGWAPEPRDRFVFINGRKYREGQAIDDKLLIERIADDSVVLSYQGERVTLKGP